MLEPCPICGETRTKLETGKAKAGSGWENKLSCWNLFTGGCHSLVSKMDPEHAEALGERFVRGGGDW